MKKLISIILCLTMVFAMAATAFAATSNTNGSPVIKIPVTKVVEQSGFFAPGEETFTFEIYDFDADEDADAITSKPIATNGVGNYEVELEFEVEDRGLIFEPFYLREIQGSGNNWTYSDVVYKVTALPGNNGIVYEFELVENGNSVNCEEAVFTNEYSGWFSFVPMNPAPSRPSVPVTSNPAPENPAEVEEANPDTGAPVFFAPAVIAVIGGAVLLGKRK